MTRDYLFKLGNRIPGLASVLDQRGVAVELRLDGFASV